MKKSRRAARTARSAASPRRLVLPEAIVVGPESPAGLQVLPGLAPRLPPIPEHVDSLQSRPTPKAASEIDVDPQPCGSPFRADGSLSCAELRRMLDFFGVDATWRNLQVQQLVLTDQHPNLWRCVAVIQDLMHEYGRCFVFLADAGQRPSVDEAHVDWNCEFRKPLRANGVERFANRELQEGKQRPSTSFVQSTDFSKIAQKRHGCSLPVACNRPGIHRAFTPHACWARNSTSAALVRALAAPSPRISITCFGCDSSSARRSRASAKKPSANSANAFFTSP